LARTATRYLGVGIIGNEHAANTVGLRERAESRHDPRAAHQRVQFEDWRSLCDVSRRRHFEETTRMRRLVGVAGAQRLHARSLLIEKRSENFARACLILGDNM